MTQYGAMASGTRGDDTAFGGDAFSADVVAIALVAGPAADAASVPPAATKAKESFNKRFMRFTPVDRRTSLDYEHTKTHLPRIRQVLWK